MRCAGGGGFARSQRMAARITGCGLSSSRVDDPFPAAELVLHAVPAVGASANFSAGGPRQSNAAIAPRISYMCCATSMPASSLYGGVLERRVLDIATEDAVHEKNGPPSTPSRRFPASACAAPARSCPRTRRRRRTRLRGPNPAGSRAGPSGARAAPSSAGRPRSSARRTSRSRGMRRRGCAKGSKSLRPDAARKARRQVLFRVVASTVGIVSPWPCGCQTERRGGLRPKSCPSCSGCLRRAAGRCAWPRPEPAPSP